MLASGGADNVVKVGNMPGRTDSHHQRPHQAGDGLRFIGKTTNFATTSGDGTVRFWNIGGG